MSLLIIVLEQNDGSEIQKSPSARNSSSNIQIQLKFDEKYMIFPQMTSFDHENVLKSLENGPKLMIITVQNRQHYAEKVYHFYLVRVETSPLLFARN